MAKPFQLHGLIVKINRAEIHGNFEKRIFELREKDSEKYPQHYQLECHQGDANILDNFSVGDEVTCWIDLRGRLWENNDKRAIFHTLKCYKIQKVEPVYNNYSSVQQPTINAPEPQMDDLPF